MRKGYLSLDFLSCVLHHLGCERRDDARDLATAYLAIDWLTAKCKKSTEEYEREKARQKEIFHSGMVVRMFLYK